MLKGLVCAVALIGGASATEATKIDLTIASTSGSNISAYLPYDTDTAANWYDTSIDGLVGGYYNSIYDGSFTLNGAVTAFSGSDLLLVYYAPTTGGPYANLGGQFNFIYDKAGTRFEGSFTVPYADGTAALPASYPYALKGTASVTYTVPGRPSVVFQSAIAAVPEPASWAMMIGGVAVVGGAIRRRRALAA